MKETPPKSYFTNIAKRHNLRRLRGFTIVELVIVVVVIAILAAVVAVAYSGVTKSAREATLKSDLKNATAELTLYQLKNKSYPTSDESLAKSKDTILGLQLTGSGYCLTAHSRDGRAGPFRVINGGRIEDGKCPPIVTDIASGWGHTCALFGTNAYCWGGNSKGALGDGTTQDSHVPVAVKSDGALAGKTITKIAVGWAGISCAIADGRAYCWGSGVSYLLGRGTTFNSSVPVPVSTDGVLAGRTVTDIAIGSSHVCVVADGEAFCWGRSNYGELGNGYTGNPAVTLPVAVDTNGALAGKVVTAISAGPDNTCAIADGNAYCWGRGTWGNLGNGLSQDFNTPTAVSVSGELADKTVTQISVGDAHACAIADGELFCWGSGSNNKHGTGFTGNAMTPLKVSQGNALEGKVVTSIADRVGQVCAIADSTVYCWGWGVYGDLGNGTLENQPLPTPVLLEGSLQGKLATALSGNPYPCAIFEGTAACWSRNGTGRIGDGTTIDRLVPTSTIPFPEL